MKWRAAGWVCVLAVFVSHGLVGQRTRASEEDTDRRSVQGIVTDAAGNHVDKAVVQLKNTKTLQIRSFITETDGAYHFAGLSTDVDYELRAEHDGHRSPSKTLSVFNSKKVATINLKLKKT
ncbi:MAG: carboxypeptidase-like regulatory domain-containing protein [Bryobacteraceae bacterium]|jgi:hypothetical protein